MGIGREGIGGRNWEITLTYTLPWVKLTASGKLLRSTGSPAPCSVIAQKDRIDGGVQEGGRIFIHRGD